jgi:two-component system, cell cycle response regulator
MNALTPGSSARPEGSALQLVVVGLSAMERTLLEGTVKLWQRRSPRLDLLPPHLASEADVVMIDARDAAAVAWARTTPVLAQKPVIWIDGVGKAAPGHMAAPRPVQWPILPVLLAKALDGHRAVQTGAATPPRPDFSPAQQPIALPRDADAAAIAGRVLVVDDSAMVRAHTRNLLQAEGYTVVEAESGQAALDKLVAARVACVFMDVLMPGLDGYDTCRRIKSQARALGVVPVVMLTSRSSPFDRIRGKMAGCDGYLVKPVEASALRDALRAAIAGRASAAVPTLSTAVAPRASLQLT